MKISVAKDLTALRDAALEEIDRQASIQRSKVNTPNKLEFYEYKKKEADMWIAAKNKARDIRNFPYLEAETGITAPTADALATLWVDNWFRGMLAGPAIERTSFLAKKNVREATSPSEIAAILAALSFSEI
jgi:hypothetical protein